MSVTRSGPRSTCTPGRRGRAKSDPAPAVNFAEGTRYVVALRNLKRTDGSTIETPAGSPPTGRDGRRRRPARPTSTRTSSRCSKARESPRDDLYLAWDFTVASERNLAERMLHMRDDAFSRPRRHRTSRTGSLRATLPSSRLTPVPREQTTWTDSRGVQRSQQVRAHRGTRHRPELHGSHPAD